MRYLAMLLCVACGASAEPKSNRDLTSLPEIDGGAVLEADGGEVAEDAGPAWLNCEPYTEPPDCEAGSAASNACYQACQMAAIAANLCATLLDQQATGCVDDGGDSAQCDVLAEVEATC